MNIYVAKYEYNKHMIITSKNKLQYEDLQKIGFGGALELKSLEIIDFDERMEKIKNYEKECKELGVPF